VAVVAILAAIAFPAYSQYIIRGKRASAKAQMMDIANREQQFLIANRSYADTATLVANGYVLSSEASDNYDWEVTAGTDTTSGAPTFTITFTPTGGQISDGPLTLDNQGTKTPIEKWTR